MTRRAHLAEAALKAAPDPDSGSAGIYREEAALDQAAADFAARAGALGDLLQRWRRPAVARTVITSLLAGDTDTFRELLRDFDPPVLGKCWWVRDVVERVVAAVEYRTVCRLRNDLTAGERLLYLQLARQFRDGARIVVEGGTSLQLDGGAGPEITPGPLLDALRAEGLVVCSEEPVEGAGLQQVLARPSRVCV